MYLDKIEISKFKLFTPTPFATSEHCSTSPLFYKVKILLEAFLFAHVDFIMSPSVDSYRILQALELTVFFSIYTESAIMFLFPT